MKFYTAGRDAMAKLGLEITPEMERVEPTYPVYLNDYYLGLIDPADWRNDPIARQSLPDPQELADLSSSYDPLAEEEQMPTPHLIHRFVDRVVLLATGRCAMRCRFCFRKRAWTSGMELADLSDEQLAGAVGYLTAHPAVKEVLISGGDPLMLPFGRLKAIVDAVAAVPSIQVIRIGSRMPVVWPERVTAEIAEYFGSIPGLWFATHFNHPREVTPEAAAACGRLVRAGVPVVNQSVLLKGVNDDAELLEELDRIPELLRIRFTSPYPTYFNGRLIDAIAKSRTVCHNIHLPLQSGSDRMLKAMNRQYTHDSYLEVVNRIRAAMPDVTFSTDVIVGFPGETDGDFKQTREVMNTVGFDNSFIFKYSPRPGARSAALADSVPQEVKEERNQILLNDLKLRVEAFLKQQIGTTQEILVEGVSPRNPARWCGRTGTNRLIHFEPEEGLQAGTLRSVTVTRAGSVSLFGELV